MHYYNNLGARGPMPQTYKYFHQRTDDPPRTNTDTNNYTFVNLALL